MQTSSGASGRDRKRAQTFQRIHDAAVELTLRDGLAAATASAIAERAEVSRRTFFNYFPCKEDAVLGIAAPTIPPHALDEFLNPALAPSEDDVNAGKDRFVAALNLTVSTMATSGHRPDPRVHDLIVTYPELVARVRAHRDETQELLVTALSEKLSERTTSTSAAGSARALILLAGAVLRFAYYDDPTILDNPDSASIAHAVATFRHALKEIK